MKSSQQRYCCPHSIQSGGIAGYINNTRITTYYSLLKLVSLSNMCILAQYGISTNYFSVDSTPARIKLEKEPRVDRHSQIGGKIVQRSNSYDYFNAVQLLGELAWKTLN